jgi:hypothetical protein
VRKKEKTINHQINIDQPSFFSSDYQHFYNEHIKYQLSIVFFLKDIFKIHCSAPGDIVQGSLPVSLPVFEKPRNRPGV